ncbi:MAG TPA: hypothetical protein VIV12_05035 [Streptosporangiaceae bacterium]
MLVSMLHALRIPAAWRLPPVSIGVTGFMSGITLLVGMGLITAAWLQSSASDNTLLYVIVPINTAGGVGMAFAVGRAWQRFAQMQRAIEEQNQRLHSLEMSNMDVTIAQLTERITALAERVESVHRVTHDLRNALMLVNRKLGDGT